MATESGYKKNVASGTIVFPDRLTEAPEALVPVAEPKHDEAVDLMEELQQVMRRHYLKSDKMNPLDVARCANALANMWSAKQQRIVEEKYHGRSRKRP